MVMADKDQAEGEVTLVTTHQIRLLTRSKDRATNCYFLIEVPPAEIKCVI